MNKADVLANTNEIAEKVRAEFGLDALLVSAHTGGGIEQIRPALARLVPEGFGTQSIACHLAGAGDVVLLVMPQDIQAPKGRLILPQVQTIRDLLDGKALVLSCTTDCMDGALAALKEPPQAHHYRLTGV